MHYIYNVWWILQINCQFLRRQFSLFDFLIWALEYNFKFSHLMVSLGACSKLEIYSLTWDDTTSWLKVESPGSQKILLNISNLFSHLQTYLIFVIFLTPALISSSKFDTKKCVNCDKTNFATKQRKSRVVCS